MPWSSGITLSGYEVWNCTSHLENVRETPPEEEVGREAQRNGARLLCHLLLDFRLGGITHFNMSEATAS